MNQINIFRCKLHEELHAFIFTSNTFISNNRLKLAKNQANAKQHPVALSKIIHILHSRYHSKIIRHILKNKQKNTCLCIHEIMLLIITKMKTKMRNSSHRQDINSSRSRHWQKYRKHEKCLSTIKLACIKQHLSIIWSSIYEKVKQFKLSWVEKRRCL